MDKAQTVALILLCVFALALPGCATAPEPKKAEPAQPQVRRPAATDTRPARKPQPPEERPQPPEETQAPPKPMKPPSIGGSGG